MNFTKINKIITLWNNYGIAGLMLYFKIKTKSNQVVSINYPSAFKYPIFLRTETTDFSVFMEVIAGKAYDFSYKFIPHTIIDCGANIGLTSIFFKNTYPDALVVAIEPEENNFQILSKNLLPYTKVVIYKNGIWHKPAKLKIENTGVGNWGFTVKETEESGKNIVTAISIKDIMIQNNIDFIDILKIDIEGSEKELFESNYDYWLPKTKIIIIEVHDWIRKGAAQSFFNALVTYKYEIGIRGQNLICFLQQKECFLNS